MAFVPVEERVKRSDLIVIGKVTAVTDTKIDDKDYKKVEVAVSETLKGKSDKKITVLIQVNPRRNKIPAVDADHLFYLKREGAEKDATYNMAANFTMFSIVETKEAEEAKKALTGNKDETPKE